ncbi:hypothetical protein CLV36_1062 [Laceyella sediminis]|uniref:Uncharacterized protein n=1 Tax=Laceyella sediminis TaxID=573074 RepID=A0ABX5ENV0_9BACL|nr:hypothetical protein CLV36_1062 [Laceyella sediminis]
MLEDKRFDVRRIKEIHLIERIETFSDKSIPNTLRMNQRNTSHREN